MDILLTIVGTLVSAVLIGVGYIMKQQTTVVRELTKSVNILTSTVAVQDNKSKNMILNCNSKHFVIDNRLDAYKKDIKENGDRLDDIDVEIARIQEKLKK